MDNEKSFKLAFTDSRYRTHIIIFKKSEFNFQYPLLYYANLWIDFYSTIKIRYQLILRQKISLSRFYIWGILKSNSVGPN